MIGFDARTAALCIALAACGTTDDNRPLDAQYITEAVLAPTCGVAQCHSTYKQANGIVLDTLEGMRRSMIVGGLHGPLIALDSTQFDPSDTSGSSLITWVTKIDPFGFGIGRMPFDAPMPNGDIHLLERWIIGPTQIRDDKTSCSPMLACPPGDTCTYAHPNDATGNCLNITYQSPAKGAQCNPEDNFGIACRNRDRVNCNSDWNFGTFVETCSSDCVAGQCTP